MQQENSDHKPPSSETGKQPSLSDLLFKRAGIWIVLTVLVMVAAAIWGYRIMRETRFLDDSAKAMAACHQAPQGEGVSFGAFTELPDKMPQLPFFPVFPQRIEELQPTFIEAHYCEMGERDALQVRLKSAAGNSYSLFELPLESSDPDIKANELIGEGVRVRLWRQDGLLMGLVGRR